MATRGPASVLDHRETDNTVNIVRDRLTRHRSPARDYKRYSYASDCSEEEDLRVAQPYRTSFSAVVNPIRTKHERSRSTSPCTSSLKGGHRSRSKSPGGRRSHKHVTYDDRVVIRDSGTSDSIITNLSDRDYTDSSCADSAFVSDMSSSSPRDYSSELRELSQQIVREYSTSNEGAESSQSNSKNGKVSVSSQNKKHNNHVNGTKVNGSVGDSKPQAAPPSQPGGKQVRRKDKKLVVEEDYDNDRSISYRVAIQSHYSDDIKHEAAKVMESVPQSKSEETPRRPQTGEHRPSASSISHREIEEEERRSSLPQDPAVAKNRLTPAKRSISSSIGNFFRRMSPHMGRRSKKGSLKKTGSQSLSHGDDLDGSFDKRGSTGSLSRGKLRRSLMKVFGKSKKGNKSLNQSDLSVDELNKSNNSSGEEPSSKYADKKSSRYMKSIEQSSKADTDVYHKFKQKQSRESTTTPTSAPGKRQALKASPGVVSPDRTQGGPERGPAGGVDQVDRAEPPSSLDVRLVPKSVKTLQASKISSISVDDSIGDCSIDPNLTGSEPSLVSQNSASKQVALSGASHDGVSPNQASPGDAQIQPVQEQQLQTSAYTPTKSKPPNLDIRYAQMPLAADETAEYYPRDITRTPSYLRISSAVSGYGHYSKYSAYQGIAKRSPYSSTLSLRSSRSDLVTPLSPADMPIGKILNISAPTNYPPIKPDLLSSPTKCDGDVSDEARFESSGVTNGASGAVTTDLVGTDETDSGLNGDAGLENGHSANVMINSFVSTGDTVKDADHFLDLTQTEERRLLLLCSKCELQLQSENITEEGLGKIRAAVGKANLLINQKFRQFQELCDKHKNPDPGDKETKCGDLQGFWEMVKIQVDDVDDMFTEIDLMSQNGWREIKPPSRRSSSSSRSSPKSGTGSLSVSNTSTPSHTPGSRRKASRLKDTPESSPERSQKAKETAKAREEARKKMLAEKRAAMKQQQVQAQAESEGVEIYVADNSSKSNSPARTNGSEDGV